MEFLSEIGLFSGKVIILAFAIGILLILLFVLIAKARKTQPTITVENLNRKYESMAQALKSSVWEAKAFKQEQKAEKKKKKKEKDGDKKRIYVLDFAGDLRASQVENLREEVTALLTVARPGTDEALVRVESPGGMAHTYGLAAAQLVRLRQAGVHLTVAVDKVAASGGYMMACTGDRIIAAPFSIVGSIGVVAQVPNFHRLLKKHDVDYEEITAGDFKRTISMFGEITDKGRRKFMDQMEETHALFKDFVKINRPQVDLSEVATGEYWLGTRALDLKLVDEVISSDDYLFKQRDSAKIYRVEVLGRKKWSEKLAENIARMIVRVYENAWLNSYISSRFPS
ncbi:MAG: protease SohB [Bdellovibrionales bacterium]|nr:protease SohB [Bdellovibrionales bacterium]